MNHVDDVDDVEPVEPVEPVGSGGGGVLGADEVRRMAELAALWLEDAEVERLAVELAGILGHFEALEHGDTEGHRDTEDARAGRDGGGVRLRADEPGADALAEGPGEAAPGWAGGFFTVPRLASHAEDEAS